MLSNIINILSRKLVRLGLKSFCVFPIKTDRVMLKSFYGKSYSCNPKYICEHLRTFYPDKFELLFVLNHPENYDLIDGVKFIKNKSLAFYYYRMTSKVIISNMTDEVYIPKRKQQFFINTWHAGGAYKRVGKSYAKTQNRAADWQNKVVCKETDFYLSSSDLFTKYNIHEAYQYEGQVLNYGLPRNDLFFDQVKVTNCRKKLEDKFQIRDKFIVLYAPTFRGDFTYNKPIDFALPGKDMCLAIKEKYGKDAVILNRSHYNDSHILATNGEIDKSVIDVSEYPDMQELLGASDMLITDYSSSIWDYALLERPCLLYVPDLENYEGDRGMYTPVSSWPGYICQTEKSLIETIEQLEAKEVSRIAKEHLRKFNSFETGTACQRMAQLIIGL